MGSFKIRKAANSWAVVAPAFNSNILRRQRQVDLYEFEASLVYRASSRTGSKAYPVWGGGSDRRTLLTYAHHLRLSQAVI